MARRFRPRGDRRFATFLTLAATLAASLEAQGVGLRRLESAAPRGWQHPLGVGDIDGDGDEDLVSRLPLLADRGIFTPSIPDFGTPASVPNQFPIGLSRTVAVGDVDVDGRDDVVTVVPPGIIVRLAGDATGVLPLASQTADVYGSVAFAAGDVDGDGSDEIAIAGASALGPSSPGIRLWRFVAGVPVDVSAGAGIAPATAHAVRLVDMDGDGLADLVVENGLGSPIAGVHVQRAMPGGSFAPPVTLPTGALQLPPPPAFAVTLGDFDGDGLRDVGVSRVLPPRIDFYRQTSPFVFAFVGAFTPESATPGSTVAVAAVDLDGDAHDELLLGTPSGTEVRAFANGSFGAPYATLPIFSQALIPIDVDGDGDRDVVAVSYRAFDGADHRILFNDGSGVPRVDPVRSEAFLGSEGRPTPVDVDGDDDLDLVAYRSSGVDGAPIVARGDGEGGFAWSAPLPCPGCPTSDASLGIVSQPPVTAAIDANLDGLTDIFVANLAAGASLLLLNDGVGGFVPTPSPSIFGEVTDFEVADVDADGLPDLVGSRKFTFGPTSNWFPGFVLRNLGGAFAGPTNLLGANGAHVGAIDVLARDFDQDGDADVILAASGAKATHVQTNNGSGVFSAAFGPNNTGISSPGLDHLLDAGDLDGDGDLDLVYGGRVHLRTTGLSFSLGASFPVVGTQPSDGLLFDADLDGDLDVLDFGAFGGRIQLNNGAAAFTTAPPLTLGLSVAGPHYRTRPTLVDLDLDGDVDAVENYGVVHAGVRRHLERRRPLDVGAVAEARVFGPPGVTCLFAVSSPGFPRVPTPFGLLAVDPWSAALLALPPVAANGETSFAAPFVGPAALALVGSSFVTQGVLFESGGLRLTNARTVDVVDF